MIKLKDKKTIFIGILLAVIVLMVVGYAALGSNLNINGVSNITSNWDILFTDMKKVEHNRGKDVSSSFDATTATFDVELQSPGDYVEYTLTVENQGTLDAILSSILSTNLDGSSAIIYTISGVVEGDILLAKEKQEVVVKVLYNPSITTQPSTSDLNQSITITLNYVQYKGVPTSTPAPIIPNLTFTTIVTPTTITVTVDPLETNPLLGSVVANSLNIDSYQFSKDGGSTFTPEQPSPTYTFTNLESGGSYDIKVRGRRGNQIVGDSEVKPIEIKKFYTNGTIIYFNPITNQICTNYHVDNSRTGFNGSNTTLGTQTGCMKWYVFNDNASSNTLNLLLDHNTTLDVRWSDTDRNNNNPYTGSLPQGQGRQGNAVWTRLQNDTTTWHINIIPTIRLITANEIAQITNHPTFNENVTSIFERFFFETNTAIVSPTCRSDTGTGDVTGCTFGWLYDRTHSTCVLRGCVNNGTHTGSGGSYWTSSPVANNIIEVWNATSSGNLTSNPVHAGGRGIRPVITVPKSLLQ